MDWILIFQILLAGMFILILIKTLPNAIKQIKHGPRGSAKEWLGVTIPLLGVALFVAFLVFAKQSLT